MLYNAFREGGLLLFYYMHMRYIGEGTRDTNVININIIISINFIRTSVQNKVTSLPN